MDRCSQCGLDIRRVRTVQKGHLSLDPKPSPEGDVEIRESGLAERKPRDTATIVRAQGTPLFKQHECRRTDARR